MLTVQVGAVLTETIAVDSGSGRRRVLSTGRNDVEKHSDASAHAEMVCLQASIIVLSYCLKKSAPAFVLVIRCRHWPCDSWPGRAAVLHAQAQVCSRKFLRFSVFTAWRFGVEC